MKIPKIIKIGKEVYKIKEKRLICLDRSIAGNINYGMRTMTLKKGMSKRGKEDCFFHEIAHGVLKELEFNYPKITKFRNDETFVQELGLVLRGTFLDLLNEQEKNDK